MNPERQAEVARQLRLRLGLNKQYSKRIAECDTNFIRLGEGLGWVSISYSDKKSIALAKKQTLEAINWDIKGDEMLKVAKERDNLR